MDSVPDPFPDFTIFCPGLFQLQEFNVQAQCALIRQFHEKGAESVN